MMQPEAYKPYIQQRELYISITQGMELKQVQQGTYTITASCGREYPIEPLAGTTAKDYRKRFNQLDRAVKGLMGRTGNIDPVEVTVHCKDRDITLLIDPTPEQETAAAKELCRMLLGNDSSHREL